jgi:hypothetical protein
VAAAVNLMAPAWHHFFHIVY